jgi:hypothetical protein
MKVIGVDFTSTPSRRKPITCALCKYKKRRLTVLGYQDLQSFFEFEELLRRKGKWIAGLDFPFGQSRKLVTDLGWPTAWEDYVSLVGNMSRQQFVDVLEAYKAPREKGDKEHKRITDQLAGSISPQKIYGVPVGKMFFEGAPRLLRSPASIVPLCLRNDKRIIVEAYPALAARRWNKGQGYKSDTRAKQTEAQLRSREDIVSGLVSTGFQDIYGFEVEFSDQDRQRYIDDPKGDQLDALICAVQAAWSWSERKESFGVRKEADLLEGWIVDPEL